MTPLRILIVASIVAVCTSGSARAQETWAPVIMFDGTSITINGVTSPIVNGPIPNAPSVGGQPGPGEPDPLIRYPNGVAENRSTNEWIVADTYHSRLLRFATDDNSQYAAGTYLGVIPVGNGNSAPYNPVIDDDGVIVVPDVRGNRLYAFVPSLSGYDSHEITSFLNGINTDFFAQPTRVALVPDPANGMHLAQGIGTVVVLDSAHNRVLKLQPAGGVVNPAWTLTLSFGRDARIFGSGPGNFVFPTGLAVDPAGNIYVTDPNDENLISIQVFDPNGAPLQTIAEGLSAPWSVALDATGRLFVTDAANNKIVVFAKYDALNPAASLAPIRAHIGSASQPLGGLTAFDPFPNLPGPIGVLQEPTALAFDHLGRLVVADTDDYRIQIFDKAHLNVTALAYPQTLTATDDSVTVRVSVTLPIGETADLHNVVPAIPTVSFAQGGAAVVDATPSCVVMPGASACGTLSGQTLTLANQPLVFAFTFDRIKTPIEAVGPVWFAVNATGLDAANAPVQSGNAQTYAVAVRGDLSQPPTITADLNDPRNAAPVAGWYRTAPVYVHLHADVPSKGTLRGQDGFVQEIHFNFGTTPPDEGDFYTCFNRFSANNPDDTNCSLPIFKEGNTKVWYRALSTPGLYDHLAPSSIDASVLVPAWTAIDVRLDVSPPTFTLEVRNPSNPAVTPTALNGWYSTLPLELVYTVTDLGSGIDTVQADAGGGALIVHSTSGDPFATVTFTYGPGQEGLFNTKITAFDRAGNKAEIAGVLKIDATGPVVIVPANITKEATGPSGAVVTFTASASDSNGTVPVTCTPASGSTFAIISTTVGCKATNSAGTTTKTFTIKVVDTTAPVIAQADLAAIATAPNGAIVTFRPTVSDIVDLATDAVTCTPASGTRFPIATTTVTCTATDRAGNKGTKTFKVTVAHSLPVCTAAVADPKSIWPPNHRVVNVGIGGVTNADGAAITYTIVSIFQDEPTNALGDGDTPIDGFGVGTGQARVRAERSGSGNGRVYHIKFTARADAGSCSGEVTTGVPHDQGGGAAVDGGALYNSTISGPDAANDTASTLKGVATTIKVLSNDTDPFGYSLTVTAVSAAAHGTTKINANGTITYTPAPGFAGTDTFTYTVSNGHGGSDTATVTVTIRAHSKGDGCDHDNHKNGHKDGDGCDHDRDRGGDRDRSGDRDRDGNR